MIALQIFVASAAGLVVTFGLMGLVAMLPSAQGRARSRIATITGGTALPYERHTPVLQDERLSSIPLLDVLLSGRAWTEKTGKTLEASGIPLRVGEYAATRVLAVVAGLFLGRMAATAISADAGMSVAILVAGAVVGLFFPPWYVGLRVRRRRAAIEAQLVELCEVVSSMLQTGYGQLQALTAACRELEPPISDEVQRMLDQIRLGGDIDEALREANDRLQSTDFDMIVTAIALQRTSGGNLAEILRGVAETIRDRLAFAREVSALTSKERYSAVIVAGFPLALIGMLSFVSPEIYTRLFTEVLGRLILASALTLDAVGYVVIKRLTRLEV
jgi:tight adherence protein B